MIFNEMDDLTRTQLLIYYDPTGGAGMKDQCAVNDRKVQRDPERGDKHT